MTLQNLTLRAVPVVVPETSLAEVIALLDETPLRTVVLVGDGMYFGVFTDADLKSGLIPGGVDRAELAVGSYASGLRFVGAPDMTTDAARLLMAKHDLAVLPVVAGRIFQGVVTADDLA